MLFVVQCGSLTLQSDEKGGLGSRNRWIRQELLWKGKNSKWNLVRVRFPGSHLTLTKYIYILQKKLELPSPAVLYCILVTKCGKEG